ncbi:DUF2164 domain-containing protein [Jeotgalibacillus proteolyticus]|uniref:DUF2164 domain-containing protein n=1 Tax=Jeotgalibacillus proteolyticus TaxID=2082395 RepID=A0A2S5GCH6_9BACL|nr:DUF2164 domain-containing protein [Jeotgalibacillus proteolyticus]PPA70603.1 DUF2164 domain-containing protein [Jeotgalibacillus proteolyticus]
MKDQYKLSEQTKHELIREIQSYFQEERGEEIGALSSALLLDFFLRRIGPAVYNQGVTDAHSYLSEKLEDIFEIQKTRS